jgi:hypothetical protein
MPGWKAQSLAPLVQAGTHARMRAYRHTHARAHTHTCARARTHANTLRGACMEGIHMRTGPRVFLLGKGWSRAVWRTRLNTLRYLFRAVVSSFRKLILCNTTAVGAGQPQLTLKGYSFNGQLAAYCQNN